MIRKGKEGEIEIFTSVEYMGQFLQRVSACIGVIVVLILHKFQTF